MRVLSIEETETLLSRLVEDRRTDLCDARRSVESVVSDIVLALVANGYVLTHSEGFADRTVVRT